MNAVYKICSELGLFLSQKVSKLMLKSSLFWVAAQCRFVCYWCFGTAYQGHLQRPRCPRILLLRHCSSV